MEVKRIIFFKTRGKKQSLIMCLQSTEHSPITDTGQKRKEQAANSVTQPLRGFLPSADTVLLSFHVPSPKGAHKQLKQDRLGS